MNPGLRSVLFLSLLTFLVISCGKKGPPVWVEPEEPRAPSGLTALVREDAVVLTWEHPVPKTVEEFVVLRSMAGEGNEEGGFGEFAEIARIRDSLYVDESFRAGARARYAVAALGRDGLLSERSDTSAVAPSMARVSPPANVSFRIQGDLLEISWEYPQGEGKFNVYKRSNTQGEYLLVAYNLKPLEKTSFVDGLSPEESVYYVVRAVKEGPSPRVRGESPPSDEIRVGPEDFVPSAPTGLGAALAGGKVLLYWDENPEPWVKRYRVYRAVDSGEFVRIGESRTPAFKDPDPVREERSYRVSAVGPVSEGSLSIPTMLDRGQ